MDISQAEKMGMTGPGAYVRDATAGSTRVDDLPKPKVVARKRSRKRRLCPGCGRSAYRLKEVQRILHDLGDTVAGRPQEIRLTYSQHRCLHCGTYFNTGMDDWALPGSHYTHRGVTLAVRLVVEDGLPYRTASWHLWRDHRVFVPFATIQNWVEAGVERGKRRHRKMQKSIYSVRSHAQISRRIALDMLRDESASARFQTTTTLHLERAGA